MLSHDFLMTFKWLSHNFLITFSRFFHEFLTLFCNFLMTFSWSSHEIIMTCSWLSHIYHDSHLMNFYDFIMIFLFLSHGYLVTFSGFSWDFLMNLSWLSYDVLMICDVWNCPCLYVDLLSHPDLCESFYWPFFCKNTLEYASPPPPPTTTKMQLPSYASLNHSQIIRKEKREFWVFHILYQLWNYLGAIPCQRSEKNCQRQKVDFFDKMWKLLRQIDDFGRSLINFCNWWVFFSQKSKIPKKLLFWKSKNLRRNFFFFKDWTSYFKYHIYHSHSIHFMILLIYFVICNVLGHF